VSNGGGKTLFGGVRFGRLKKRSQALLGSNLTRDIQADAAPMARPASGGKSSEAVAFEPHWTPERCLKNPAAKPHIPHRLMPRTLQRDDPDCYRRISINRSSSGSPLPPFDLV
jgi:hypothetical protein